tara:strand:+ start:511 stop:1134 length:624 start_codon:yes stop_codon:yes gene_type:complete
MRFKLTPAEIKQVRRKKLAEDILKDDAISIRIKNEFLIKEAPGPGKTNIECTLQIKDFGKEYEKPISGSGSGPIDALFNPLMEHLSPEYTSLKTFKFLQFGIQADLKDTYEQNSGSSAEADAIIVVRNTRGDDSIFRETSTSVIRASMAVVLKSVEFFVNVEKAVKILEMIIKDGKKRNRGDIVQRRTNQLAELVGTTSYRGIIGKK